MSTVMRYNRRSQRLVTGTRRFHRSGYIEHDDSVQADHMRSHPGGLADRLISTRCKLQFIRRVEPASWAHAVEWNQQPDGAVTPGSHAEAEPKPRGVEPVFVGLRGMIALIIGFCATVIAAPVAHAEEFVTYEVLTNSPFLTAVNVEYTSLAGPVALQNVAPPWRVNVSVADPHSLQTNIRATWQSPVRYKWVTIRIWYRGSLLCEAIEDTGEATCTAKGIYQGEIPPWMPPQLPPEGTGVPPWPPQFPGAH